MMPTVSVIIVCMNNLKYLYPCLDSIKKFTKVSYEVLVTAYLFSPENLSKVRQDYPWVRFIENNEYKGFAENNNLCLRQASGKYCFVVNDDTEMNEPVIDELVQTYESLDDKVAMVSPKLLNMDGSTQVCGLPKSSIWTDFLDVWHLGSLRDKSEYTNKPGIFQSYNAIGAAFLIPTDLFREVGFFDERYFFCPEDWALSTKLNQMGYKCMVNADIHITHFGGGTWSKTITATKPAHVKGLYIFYCENSLWKKIFFIFYNTVAFVGNWAFWFVKNLVHANEKAQVMMKANMNGLASLFLNKTPKELFVKYYTQMKQNNSKEYTVK